MKPLKDWTLQEVKDYCLDENNTCECCALKCLCDTFPEDAPEFWNLTPPPPPTQEETIVWHKYPEDKPTWQGIYLVQYPGHVCDDMFNCLNNTFGSTDSLVKAWAEMPKGYKDGKSTSLFDVNTYEGSIVDPPLKCNCAEYDALQEKEEIE